MPQAPRIDIITVYNPLRKLQSMLENALVTPKKRAKKMKQSPEKAAEEVNPLVDEDVSMIPVYEVSDHYMNLKGGGAGDAPLPLKRKQVKDVILCRISTNDTNVCKLFTGCPRSVGLPLANKPFFKKLQEAIEATRPNQGDDEAKKKEKAEAKEAKAEEEKGAEEVGSNDGGKRRDRWRRGKDECMIVTITLPRCPGDASAHG